MPPTQHGISALTIASYWYNLMMGFTVWTVGLGLLSTIDIDTSTAKLVGYQVLNAIGAGQTFQTSLMAIQASVSREDVATATGLRNFLRMLGGTFSLAICSVLVNNIVRKQLEGEAVSADIISRVLADPTATGDLSGAQKDLVLRAYGELDRVISTDPQLEASKLVSTL